MALVEELDLLLTTAKIEPPYILVGGSFGSYNMHLYAHNFPDKVMGFKIGKYCVDRSNNN